MRLKKFVPMVGFCAFSLLSSSAMAQLWAVNCEKNQCLDATTQNSNGKVQVSNCDPKKIGQQWFAEASVQPSPIQNAYEGFGKPCLDMTVKNQVVTNACQSYLKAQLWYFAPNGSADTIENGYFRGQCLTVKDDSTVTSASCNQSQRWAWVNVGDDSPNCPSTAAPEPMPLN
jgi:hypothetical protein